MKKSLFGLLLALIFAGTTFAQEVSLGADVVSNYIWRGTKFGGPSIQPTFELGFGDLAVGTWGSFALTNDAPMENDFYASYSLGDISFGVTDYYYQGVFSDFSDTAGSHALEINAGYTMDALSISANYIVNEAGGALSVGGDTYIEVGYSLEKVDLFVGAGNGWHTVADSKGDHPFAVVNIGVSASKEVKINDSFSIPVSGAIIYNPDGDVSYFYVGFTF